MNGPDDMPHDLGPCCVCGRAQDGTVRNLLILPFRAPPGTIGWGCLACGLPFMGAGAVVCDSCVSADQFERPAAVYDRLQWIIGGEYPGDRVRVPLEGYIRTPFLHDQSKHQEDE